MTLKSAIEVLLIRVKHGYFLSAEEEDEAIRQCEVYISPAVEPEKEWDM